MFINSPFYLEQEDGQSLPPDNKIKVHSVHFTFIEPSQSFWTIITNRIIIWVITFNAESSIWRSYHLRLTLYGCPETPSCNHFEHITQEVLNQSIMVWKTYEL